MSTALVIAIVALSAPAALFAIALWDVGRRWAAQGRLANDKLREHYTLELERHDAKYKLALNELGRQMQAEIDSMSAEVTEGMGHVYTKLGLQLTKGPEPWQQRRIDERSKTRTARKLQQQSGDQS